MLEWMFQVNLLTLTTFLQWLWSTLPWRAIFSSSLQRRYHSGEGYRQTVLPEFNQFNLLVRFITYFYYSLCKVCVRLEISKVNGPFSWARYRNIIVNICTVILQGFLCDTKHAAAAAAKSLQSCLTLCDPTDSSPPGSPIPGILQARTLEWVAIAFSNAWKWKVKVKSLSCVWLLVTPWTVAYQAPSSMGFSRQEYWSGVPLPSPIQSI